MSVSFWFKSKLLVLLISTFLITFCKSIYIIPVPLSESLPLVIINTMADNIGNQRIYSKMQIVDTPDMGIGYKTHRLNYSFSSPNIYDGIIGIKLRGNWGVNDLGRFKKSYSLETRNERGENLNISILGMPRENDYLLQPAHIGGIGGDLHYRSFFHTLLPFKIYEKLGYAPRFFLVELIINGDYRGIYAFMEKIKRDKNRINVKKMDSSDIDGDKITGGWLIRVRGDEPYNFGREDEPYDFGWTSKQFTHFRFAYEYQYPKPKNITPEQESYIQGVVGRLEDMFLEPISTDIENLDEYIDVSSWLDYIAIIELVYPPECCFQETFLYKDRDSITGNKFFMGPPWDLDGSLRNLHFPADLPLFLRPTGWRILLNNCTKQWLCNVYSAPQIRREFVSYWKRIRKEKWSDAQLEKIVLDFFKPVKTGMIVREMHRFYPELSEEEVVNDWREKVVTRLLENLIKRAHWIDQNINSLNQ